jgi:hypothetical protein
VFPLHLPWRLVRVLLFLGGMAVLAILVVRIGAAVIADSLVRVGWGFVWVSALYMAHVAMRAMALWRSLPNARLRYREVLRVRLAGEAVEAFTFTGPFLAEPTKAWLLVRTGTGMTGADAFGGVAAEYLLYTIVSAAMAAVTLGVLTARGTLPAAFRPPVFALLAAIFAFLAACVQAAISGIGLIAPIVRRAGAVIGRRAIALAERLDPIERVLVALLHERPARLGEVLAIEIVGHALLACEIWVVFNALHVHVMAADPFLYEGGVKFIGVAFFFVPGQVGAAESAYALVARALGFPLTAGLTLALVRRIRTAIVAGVGLATAAGCANDHGADGG